MLRDDWLSSVTGIACFRFEALNIDYYLKEIKCFDSDSPFFNTIRTQNSLVSLENLMPTELRFVQQMNHYVWNTNKLNLRTNQVVDTLNSESDILAILNFSRNAFSMSRFHQDTRFSLDLAERIKSEWIYSNLTTRENAHNFIIKNSAGEVIGFNSILNQLDKIIIDLITVAPEYRGQGVGMALILKCQELSSATGKPIFVGTQVNNPAIGLYEKLGFTLYRTSFVWHHSNLGFLA